MCPGEEIYGTAPQGSSVAKILVGVPRGVYPMVVASNVCCPNRGFDMLIGGCLG